MKAIKVGAAVLNQTPLDWVGNRRHILEALDQARAENVSLLCLPELCITGYGCEDAFHAPGVQKRALQELMDLIPHTSGLVVSVGLPILYTNALFNCAALLVDGKLVGLVAKQFLAGDGIHYEPRWFKPWQAGVQVTVELETLDSQGNLVEIRVPMGDLLFDLEGVRVGFEICEDAWVATRPGGPLARKGVDIILNPSASHFAFGKFEVRKRFVLEGSRAFNTTYVYANLLGCEAGRAIYDGGALIASGGRLVAQGPRLTFHGVGLSTAVVDLELTRMNQSRTSSFRPALEERNDGCVTVEYALPAAGLEKAVVVEEAWERGQIKEEEFSRAIALGLHDYLRKSRSYGFVVSLSGGADSAAVCCLVALMVARGLEDLGLEKFKARLGYIPGLKGETGPELVHSLLTTAYQGTAQSSSVTRNAARAVAEGLGAAHLELDVDALVKGYIGMVSEGFGRALTWEQDDIPLQNIQARVRAPGIWLLANLRNGLLLATSNRSEAAVGYATMDGDTCGGLSPLAGIDKHWLRHWLRWLEKEGPCGLGPIPALHAINVQQPTAELRPAAQAQTDEKDLMPYDLLDVIERAAIRDKKVPLEVIALLEVTFPQYGLEQLGVWVDRFFKLWCRNQWKRERYAPSFHLDDENLDPRSWCRFPILSGGFAEELAEMWRMIRTRGAL